MQWGHPVMQFPYILNKIAEMEKAYGKCRASEKVNCIAVRNAYSPEQFKYTYGKDKMNNAVHGESGDNLPICLSGVFGEMCID